MVSAKTSIFRSLAPPHPLSSHPHFNNQFLWLLAKLHGTKQLLAWLSQCEGWSVYLKNANMAPIKTNPASAADENCSEDMLWYDGEEIKANMNMKSIPTSCWGEMKERQKKKSLNLCTQQLALDK